MRSTRPGSLGGAGNEANETRVSDIYRRLFREMNEKFIAVTETQTEEMITDACVQVIQLLDRLKMKNGAFATNENHLPAGNAGRTARGRRGSCVDGPRRCCCRSSDGAIHPNPAPVVERQTSFDKAMGLRMAELVENDHAVCGLWARPLSVPMTPQGTGLAIFKHWTHLLYGEEGMHDALLNFRDPSYQTIEKKSDYLSFKRSGGSIVLLIFIVVVLTIYVGTVFWYADNTEVYTHNPMAVVSIIVGTFTGLMMAMTLFLRLSHFSFMYDIRMLQWSHTATERFYKSRYSRFFDDGMVIGGALATSLYMISQLLALVCPAGTTILHLHSCSRQGSIAPEGAVLITVVLWLQMLARGVSRVALVCAWIIILATTNVSLWLVGSHMSYLRINLELLCLIALSYELERWPLRQFIKSVRMLEAAEVNTQLRVALSKEQMRESENALEAKRSMVRYIGHEIRIPLNIIGVGTDLLLKELKQLGSTIPRSILEVVEGIEDASTDAVEVVNELLMFEKLAAGMTTIEAVPTRIVSFIDKVAKKHLLPAQAKNIDFKVVVEPCDNDLGADIDPVKMIVVFRNIFR